MKTLHVYRTYFPSSQGGLEETIRQMCHASAAYGTESRVIAPAPAPSPKVVKVDNAWVYQPKKSFEIASCTFSLEMFQTFAQQAEWADVIHYHFPWPFADLLHLWTNPRKPSVLTYHSDIVRQKGLSLMYRPLMNRFLDQVDRIVCTSPNYFATSEALANFESKTTVIPFGIDPKTYPEPSDKVIDEVRKQYGENFFLFVGVLRYYKGLHILIDALEGRPYRAVIAGSGPIEAELRARAKARNLENVDFAGYVSNEVKSALFKLCKAIVFPSYLRAEAFGVTLLEGAMFGKPLISTEVGSGTSHVNIHNETGLVVAPGSPKALRKAMDEMYAKEQRTKNMGKLARERFQRHFSSLLMGQRYNALYQSVCGHNISKPKEFDFASNSHRS